MQYRRVIVPGGTFFFTVNLENRSRDLLIAHVDTLRVVMRKVQSAHPFDVVAIVILPEHLHCVWTLPGSEADNATRWSLIKAGFARRIRCYEHISDSRLRKRERGIWQRRYWEHQIRDERDLQQHVDYIHYNPVKHGYVAQAACWRYSSIHRYIRRGWLTSEWGGRGTSNQASYGERC